MAEGHEDEIAVTAGSDNVFADLGVNEAQEELAKAQLAFQIRAAIGRRKLTQVGAGKVIGLDQPKVSALMNGRLEGFSSDRLMRCLIALGEDVDIVVRNGATGNASGRLRVIGGAACEPALVLQSVTKSARSHSRQ